MVRMFKQTKFMALTLQNLCHGFDVRTEGKNVLQKWYVYSNNFNVNKTHGFDVTKLNNFDVNSWL